MSPPPVARWIPPLSLLLYGVHAGLHHGFLFQEAAFPAAAAEALAAGDGFSPWPGAPWTETFGSPLLVLLLLPAALLGISTTATAQVLGAGFGAAGLGLSYLLARRLGAGVLAAGAAPLFLALSPTWVSWSVSGTDQALFAALLLGGLARLLLEHEEPHRRPLSALLLGLAGIASSEGILYVLAALGSWGLLTGNGRRMMLLGALSALPWLGWGLVRVVGFGEWLPAAWVGLLEVEPRLRTAWRYLYGFLEDGQCALPVLALLGLLLGGKGTARLGRGLLASGVVVGLGLVYLWRGDWALGHRLLHPVVALLAPLMAAGLGWMLSRIRFVPLRVGLGALALYMLLGPAISLSARLLRHPEITVHDARLRVEHIRQHAAAHGIERPMVVDPDIAVYMLDTDWPALDLSGRSNPHLVRERSPADWARRVFEEERPAYLHVHSGWDSQTRLTRHPDWKATYVEIPPYLTEGGKPHVGTYVRRDLVEGVEGTD